MPSLCVVLTPQVERVFSPAVCTSCWAQDEARHLLLAMNRLRLHPVLMSAMPTELSQARELLAEAWAQADAGSWAAAQPLLAQQLAQGGPTHRAALNALLCHASTKPQALQLSQAAATALLERLVTGGQVRA